MILDGSLLQLEIFTIILWISLWGLIDNLINKYTAHNNYNARIIAFLFITFISILGIIFR